MSRNFLDDVSKALIRDAEHDCAESDPDEIGDSAAMVLVGDIYAIRVCHDEMSREGAKPDDSPTDDTVSPFIR